MSPCPGTSWVSRRSYVRARAVSLPLRSIGQLARHPSARRRLPQGTAAVLLPRPAAPLFKEAHFFTQRVSKARHPFRPWMPEDRYVRELLGAANATSDTWRRAAFEASPSYVRNGAKVAPAVRAVLPWVRVVMLLREPISRATSALVHMHERHETRGEGKPSHTACLAAGGDVFPCLVRMLERDNYSDGLAGWLRAFPARQVFAIQ